MPKVKSSVSFRKERQPSAALGINMTTPDDEELKFLEKLVLGTGTELFDHSSSDGDSDEEVKKKKRAESKEKRSVRKPAWIDDDDQKTYKEVVDKQIIRLNIPVNGPKDYNEVLQKKFHSINAVPKWAEVQAPDIKEESDILKRCGNLIKKPSLLEKGKIELKKLKDLNCETYSEGAVIKVVKFHPTSTVALVAGASGIASLFQADGKQNAKLQSIQFQRFPINCGSFYKNGEEFVIGSRNQRYLYSYNLMTGQSSRANFSKIIDITKMKNLSVSPNGKILALCGDFGHIYLLSATTKEYITHLKMNNNVNALDFNESGTKLYSHGDDGEVYIWDMRTRSCIQKFIDDGCLNGTSIAASPNGQLIACGSSSGVVNVYESDNITTEKSSHPIKAFYNLVTPVNSVKFNSTSEILIISSDYKDNAVKLLHCPSMTVYSNFPSFQSKIGRPQCVDFSPNSGFFAIGDNKGSAHLFRLKFYGNY